jgi:hypothetical protein
VERLLREHSAFCSKKQHACPFNSLYYLRSSISVSWALLLALVHNLLHFGFCNDWLDIHRCAGLYADIATLQAAQQHGLTWHSMMARGVALSGSLPKLTWLCDEERVQPTDDMMNATAQSGSVEMLQFLKQRGCAVSSHTSLSAARRPRNIPVLQYLLDEGCAWSPLACGVAAEIGDLEQLQWLHQHSAPCNVTPQQAARSGAVSICDWLLQQQLLELNCDAMHEAATYGHLQLCKWLRSAGCPWNGTACEAAARGGHLEVLQFLHESGCVWDDTSILYEAADVSILQYLWEQGLQQVATAAAQLSDVLSYTGSSNKLGIAQWVRQHGAEWPDVLQDIDGFPWHDSMVAWARTEGCTGPNYWQSLTVQTSTIVASSL